jgi:hypothetical protein
MNSATGQWQFGFEGASGYVQFPPNSTNSTQIASILAHTYAYTHIRAHTCARVCKIRHLENITSMHPFGVWVSATVPGADLSLANDRIFTPTYGIVNLQGVSVRVQMIVSFHERDKNTMVLPV